jgi:hypothetical protein
MLTININKLRNEVELREQKKIKIFDKILDLCYQRILNSNQKNDDYSCTYIVPNVVFGLPLYNVNDCVSFVINKLIEKGFNVVFAFPTTIHISWKPNDSNTKYNSQSRYNNQLSIYNNKNNIQLKDANKKDINIKDNNIKNNNIKDNNIKDNNIKDINIKNNKYKKIDEYKNSESIIYNQNDINLFQSKLDTLFD